MKLIRTVLPAVVSLGLASCGSTVTSGPVHTAPLAASPARPKAQPESDGALKQVSPKPKPYPEIPLKQDTGVSPLIHNKTDTPTYQRSGS